MYNPVLQHSQLYWPQSRHLPRNCLPQISSYPARTSTSLAPHTARMEIYLFSGRAFATTQIVLFNDGPSQWLYIPFLPPMTSQTTRIRSHGLWPRSCFSHKGGRDNLSNVLFWRQCELERESLNAGGDDALDLACLHTIL